MTTSVAPNVMILAVGRQVLLAEAFARAVGDAGHVLACDADRQAPGLDAAHKGLVSPRWTAPEYPDWLLDTCARYDVALLLTLHEGDLNMLERIRPELERTGVALLGSPRTAVDSLVDKLSLAALLEAADLRVPTTLPARELVRSPDAVSGPLQVKARAGRASLGVATFAHGDAFLRWAEAQDDLDDYVVQPRLEGSEYGMDVVNDLDGEYAGYLGRRKLRMVAGETDRAVTVVDARLDEAGRQLSLAVGHFGPFDVDLLDVDGRLEIIDVNPRFGGGYAFSHIAGANLPAQLVAWRSGESGTNHLAYRPGVVAQRRSRVERVGTADHPPARPSREP